MNGIKILLLLLSPFIYLGFAIFISLFVARLVRRKVGEGKSWRPLQAGIITFVVIMLIPTWNILIARGYMYYRCWNEGGIYVYQTVAVPVEYFDGWGNPRLTRKLDPQGNRSSRKLRCFGERCFRYGDKRTIEFRLPPGSEISRYESWYQDVDSEEIIGRRISFAHSTWYTQEQSASICPSFSRGEDLPLNVFVPAKDKIADQGARE